MTGHRIATGSDAHLRVTPWRGSPAAAHLSPGRSRPTPRSVETALRDLRKSRYEVVFTTAIPPADQVPFLQAGFVVHERLHLLMRDLHAVPPVERADVDLRRGHRGDHDRVAEVDAAAFPEFWRLDAAGLQDAVSATPSSRLRVALARDQRPAVRGYAITGRAGPRGYVQRLAVDPRAQGQGIGGTLVIDGLRWLRRWGATEALVNTQVGNVAAVRLYERLGFTMQPEGLAVLTRSIERARP